MRLFLSAFLLLLATQSSFARTPNSGAPMPQGPGAEMAPEGCWYRGGYPIAYGEFSVRMDPRLVSMRDYSSVAAILAEEFGTVKIEYRKEQTYFGGSQPAYFEIQLNYKNSNAAWIEIGPGQFTQRKDLLSLADEQKISSVLRRVMQYRGVEVSCQMGAPTSPSVTSNN